MEENIQGYDSQSFHHPHDEVQSSQGCLKIGQLMLHITISNVTIQLIHIQSSSTLEDVEHYPYSKNFH